MQKKNEKTYPNLSDPSMMMMMIIIFFAIAIDASFASVVRTFVDSIGSAAARWNMSSSSSSSSERCRPERHICWILMKAIVVLHLIERSRHDFNLVTLLASRIDLFPVSSDEECYQTEEHNESYDSADYSTGNGTNIV